MYKNRRHPTEAECRLFCCPILLSRCRFCSFLKLLSYRHTANGSLFAFFLIIRIRKRNVKETSLFKIPKWHVPKRKLLSISIISLYNKVTEITCLSEETRCVMNFHEKLNEYIQMLPCTAKELSELSGLSAATLSRYRSGERVPDMRSSAFSQLCSAIARISEQKGNSTLTADAVRESFLSCEDLVTVDREQLRYNFNTLISLLNINISRLCQYTNYDTSTIFRFRSGSRQIAEPEKFAAVIAGYIAKEMDSASEKAVLAELFGCTAESLADPSVRFQKLQTYLLEAKGKREDSVSHFLSKLDAFDLNEYIKAIHFDELKLPPAMPFHLPTSKSYFGIHDMMESELDFLKATVLSRSMESVIMYSDMPMSEMAKDPDFPKKWMFGMAMMLKKGLHLHQIHNLDRSFDEMMLGLESWIPMYMTGQISPYYLKGVQNSVFLHFLKVSGPAALTGEAISGFHSDGKYYLTKSKEEVAYYRNRAEELLKNASPLMDIYLADKAGALQAFFVADSHQNGNRRNILSALPLYTMDAAFLETFLSARGIPSSDRRTILSYAAAQRQIQEEILKTSPVEDEFSLPDLAEFAQYPMCLSLSGLFYPKQLFYTFAEYQAHLAQTRAYAASHANYTFTETSSCTFRNLQIQIHEGKWAMISKNTAPTIHFVIHHPKLRSAIENFIPPLVEN